MATSESQYRPGRLIGSRRSLAGTVALALALLATGGALWLSAANHTRPWAAAFSDLTASGEACLAEGDATAHAAARVARSQSQLEGFVRDRFQQFRDQAAAAEAFQTQAATPVAAQPVSRAAAEVAKLQARIETLVSDREHLLERMLPEHPAVADLANQIAILEGQLAVLGPAAATPVASAPELRAPGSVPATQFKSLVEQTSSEYQQLAVACRHAERQLDEAQAAQSVVLDRHAMAIAHWDAAAASWDYLSATAATMTWALWSVAAVAVATLAWLIGRNLLATKKSKAQQVITDVGQIERWFSLPVVVVAAAQSALRSAGVRRDRMMPSWLVLPAQIAVAVAVFLMVAATIQNPDWPQQLASEPWQAISQLWSR